MTPGELDEFIGNHSTLYHMAERGSWDSIKKYGLQSTSALLDRSDESERDEIEKQRRAKCYSIKWKPPIYFTVRSLWHGIQWRLRGKNGLPVAVIRDQKMTDEALEKCLCPQSGLTPSDWYQILNRKCFFWLDPERVHILAKGYPDNDVLEVCARSLIDRHRSKIWLCPMNSGTTKPMAHPRGKCTFSRIEDYPYAYWKAKKRSKPPVVELTVEYEVPDIRDHMQGEPVPYREWALKNPEKGHQSRR